MFLFIHIIIISWFNPPDILNWQMIKLPMFEPALLSMQQTGLLWVVIARRSVNVVFLPLNLKSPHWLYK